MATIVVVDDNPDNLKLVRAVLAPHGHRVAEFATGVGLAEALQDNPPDLILLDLQLPDLDGFAILIELRRTVAGVPVVALTAYASRTDEAAVARAGFDGYLVKPIDVARFPDQVAQLIRRDRPAA